MSSGTTTDIQSNIKAMNENSAPGTTTSLATTSATNNSSKLGKFMNNNSEMNAMLNISNNNNNNNNDNYMSGFADMSPPASMMSSPTRAAGSPKGQVYSRL